MLIYIYMIVRHSQLYLTKDLFKDQLCRTVINLFPRAAFPPGSNSSYSRLGQVAGEPAAGVRSLDCCDLGPAAGVRRLGRPQGFPPDPGEKQHGGFYWESCLCECCLITRKRPNRLGCNIYHYLCLGPGMVLGEKKAESGSWFAGKPVSQTTEPFWLKLIVCLPLGQGMILG